MQSDETARLAEEVLEYANDALLVALRFMEPAFSRLKLVSHEGPGYRTDGAAMYFEPSYTVRSYAADAHAPARAIAHMALHCIFRHQWSGEAFDADLWDCACDIAVESCLADLGLEMLSTERSHAQRGLLARLEDCLPFLSAETVYYHLLDEGVTSEQAQTMRMPFFADDHGLWLRGTRRAHARASGAQEPLPTAHDDAPLHHEHPSQPEDEQLRPPAVPTGLRTSDSEDPSAHAAFDEAAAEPPQAIDDALAQRMAHLLLGEAEQAPDAQAIDAAGGFAAAPIAASGGVRRDTAQRTRPLPSDDFVKEQQTAWRDIALKTDVALEDFKQLWGSQGGGFSLALKRSSDERVDYAEFLRRFVGRNEDMRLNDEEFDYLFYCYGLELYGNVPLVEPLEYVDEGRIRDFVIAIDTSASTKGAMVRSFMERTYDILHESDAFAATLNLYLIQCDAQVQDVAHIQTRDDLDRYLDALEVKGFGGTDFRPVFSYVDDLVASGRLAHLKGLCYLTDGQGAYPRVKPAYDVAFLLVDEAYFEEPDVPPWALRVRLDSGEFRQGAASGAL